MALSGRKRQDTVENGEEIAAEGFRVLGHREVADTFSPREALERL